MRTHVALKTTNPSSLLFSKSAFILYTDTSPIVKVQNVLLMLCKIYGIRGPCFRQHGPNTRLHRKKPRSTTTNSILASCNLQEIQISRDFGWQRKLNVVKVNEENISNQEQHGTWHHQKFVLAEQREKWEETELMKVPSNVTSVQVC